MFGALKRAGLRGFSSRLGSLLGCGVFGDGLGTLTDGVLGELTRQQESDSSLDLTGCDGAPLVVVGKTASLGSDTLKDVIHE